MSSLDSAAPTVVLLNDEPAAMYGVPYTEPAKDPFTPTYSRWVNLATVNLLTDAPVMLSPETFASANRCQVIVHSVSTMAALDDALDGFAKLLTDGTPATLVLRSDDSGFPLDGVVDQLNRMHPELGMVYGGL